MKTDTIEIIEQMDATHAFIYRQKGICVKVRLSDGGTASFPGDNAKSMADAINFANDYADTFEIRED